MLWSHWDAATAAPGLAATVTQLLALRRALRVTAKSTVVVLRASADCYAACVDGRLAVKIGPGAWSPNKERLEGVHWTRAVEARNCCVWTRDKAGAAAER